MRKLFCGLALAALSVSLAGAAAAQETKLALGLSGWTGFAPLTLAKEAGIFKKHGLDVTLKKIPQASRHLAIQSGDVKCAATPVETWWCGTRTACRRSRSSSSTSPTAPTAWRC